ncbi:LysE family translocator [Muricoccus aerilatus]|uniref:LysE family translocator n=1 Tax=Muricoccus aerilatus TaxID=452982 RepID=UPI0005C20CC3|nr:LysE family transporter [Roseomonas aerilata]
MSLPDLGGAATDTTLLRPLAAFLAGYVMILVTPGPNMLAIGGVAALHGLRGAAPLCIGASFGAGCLGTATFLFVRYASAVPSAEGVARIAGALLLAYVAIDIARHSVLQEKAQALGCAIPAINRAAAFGVGFCTAATNPLTGSFFAAQFLGPLDPNRMGARGAWAIACIMLSALVFFLLVASLLARPPVRSAAISWHRPIRFGVAALLASMAVNTLRPVLTNNQAEPASAVNSVNRSGLLSQSRLAAFQAD